VRESVPTPLLGEKNTTRPPRSTRWRLERRRNLGKAALLGPVLFDYGRWLVQTGRTEEAAPLLEEAQTLFERMKATRWLERVAQVLARSEPEAAIP
jgi:hypothetical protein